MKVITGFISNSSSCSFIVSSKQYSVSEKERKKAFEEVLEYFGTAEEEVDEIKQLYDNGEFVTILDIPFEYYDIDEDYEKFYTQFGIRIIEPLF